MTQQIRSSEKFRSKTTGRDLEFYKKDGRIRLAETFVNEDGNREVYDVTEHYDLNRMAQYVSSHHGVKIVSVSFN